jgi:hypothetical protein
VCKQWIREQWDEITGLGIPEVNVKNVYQVEGVCYYLCKYMTKAKYSDEILAVLKRRRLWASTITARPKWDQGFVLAARVHGAAARAVIEEATMPVLQSSTFVDAPTRYWVSVKFARGIFGVWELVEWWRVAEIASVKEGGLRQSLQCRFDAFDADRERYLSSISENRREWCRENTADVDT